MKSKFNVGQSVKMPDGEVGIIQSVRADENGIHYVVSSKEVDLVKKEIINGVKHCEESELELVKVIKK
jgi:hypothetical protein